MNIVLLSGGSGKRLWPLSNDIRSKQFIKIFKCPDGSYESMVQRVYRQIKQVDKGATVTIATSKTQVSAIHNQLGEEVGISVEPCRRDTFPPLRWQRPIWPMCRAWTRRSRWWFARWTPMWRMTTLRH